jgi:hypothetical protein
VELDQLAGRRAGSLNRVFQDRLTSWIVYPTLPPEGTFTPKSELRVFLGIAVFLIGVALLIVYYKKAGRSREPK